MEVKVDWQNMSGATREEVDACCTLMVDLLNFIAGRTEEPHVAVNALVHALSKTIVDCAVDPNVTAANAASQLVRSVALHTDTTSAAEH
jgi:hypothetical protein